MVGRGIPFGKILEVAGEESSGKSLIAYNFAYSCQQLGSHVHGLYRRQINANR